MQKYARIIFFQEANSSPRAKLEENGELRGIFSVLRQNCVGISETNASRRVNFSMYYSMRSKC